MVFPFCLLELTLLLTDISMKFRELILQKSSPTNKKLCGGCAYVAVLLAPLAWMWGKRRGGSRGCKVDGHCLVGWA